MNWQTEISTLIDSHAMRIRKMQTWGFNASFRDTEIPLNAPIPKQGGACLRPVPVDYLYVVGTSADGKQRKVECGLFSSDLLKTVNEHIRK